MRISLQEDRSVPLQLTANGTILLGQSAATLPTTGGAGDPSSSLEGLQRLDWPLVVDRERIT